MSALVSRLGVVVIGRNEGARLKESLLSVMPLGCPVIYADSNSSDGSISLAKSCGVITLQLDPALPMSASRGRKEGFELLNRLYPDLEYVMFVDGDCVIEKSFIIKATKILIDRPDVSVVFGRLRELHPDRSVYNRIANLEWARPAGEVLACGGNALFRINDYVSCGGYREDIVAGEEPELCSRIRSTGGKILCIDDLMGFHDLGFSSFKQWWVRGLRSGYGALSVRSQFGVKYFDRQILSAWTWVLAWPLLSGCLVVLAAALGGPFAGACVVLLASSLLPLQVFRISLAGAARGLSREDAVVYGALMMVNKWASVAGQSKWCFERRVRWRVPCASLSNLQRDLLRYPKRPFLKEQSIWAIAVHRWGAKLHSKRNGWLKRLEFQFYWLVFRMVETLTGISLPHNAIIGPGLRIHHFGGIFVNPRTIIGANCTLRQGVTLGNRHESGGAPTVGSNVDFGAYAQVLGEVRIGDNVKIGAMAVVLEDVPANCTVVGNPARVVKGGTTIDTPLGGV